jgi:hypothetical protein
MENAPVLLFSGNRIYPGADPELSARYLGWSEESYIPLRVSRSGTRGADRYEIVITRPEYPSRLTTIHCGNTTQVEKDLKDPDRIALIADMKTWVDRRVMQNIWGHYYELMKGFRNEGGEVISKQETIVEGAPFLHL